MARLAGVRHVALEQWWHARNNGMSNKAENEAGESTGDHAAIGGTPLPPGAPPTPTLVTREQLARAMGKHSRTIRRWEQTRLAPALTVGDDGVHRFNVARVQEIFELQERATPATPESFDNGETTAAVFELFAQGVEAVDVVMRMKLPAFAVDALRRRWATLRGGYMVPREVALEISSVRGEVIADAASLLRNLKQTTPNTCDECHEEVGHQYDGWSQVFCGLCA
ncbi:MAG: hypothetical protein ACRENE_02680, partial [Polyangiaceae bacterium]